MNIGAAGVQNAEVDIMQNEEDEEGKVTDDEEPRECGVCGDLAKGYHFNALTCEGCKGFFRRAIKRSVQLHCPILNKCIITKNNRRSCQACRFRKCQAIGMRKEMVMSEKEVLERRIRIKKKKMDNASTQLSSQQEEIIQELLCGHRSTFDSTFSRFTGFRPIDRDILTDSDDITSHPLTNCPTKTCVSAGESSADPTTSLHACSFSSGPFGYSDDQEGDGNRRVYTALPHMADLTTYMIQDIIRFSKSLRDFRSLSMEDQISLLKGATFEIMLIRFNMVFNPTTNKWECGHITYCTHDVVRAVCFPNPRSFLAYYTKLQSMTDNMVCRTWISEVFMASAGFQLSLIEPIYKFHHTLRKLDLQEEEYAIIQAMSLFSPDRPGVQQHSVIDRAHENLALTLKTWIECRRTGPNKHLLFPKVIACFTELRTMAEEYSKQILQIQDIQPDTISPLIMEVVSKNTSCDS